MIDVDGLLEKRRMKPDQLILFGFLETENGYVYSTDLIAGKFEMLVFITKEGKLSAEVIDRSSKERYILHRVPVVDGTFVRRVRAEYERVLDLIVTACFEPDVFKSESARQVICYIKEKYCGELEFLWERFPENAVFRRQDNAKWYAALLVVQKRKLGLDAAGVVDIIDLRVKPEDISSLVDGRRYFAGFHMNKRYWITICLDGFVPIDEVYRRIDESFLLASK
ncbi:MAG: MmcQ/YjbR family DNA-binding protein [Nitrososphaerota archaeon]|jgi:predicted DNA-binding protein (MmcQ/YjbR family)|uniref:MmcQ/YjbR family DNA-binding protein n=1 Tax=Candidatus Bathycorpusculum sp. TaxID=2994959 RepID=UPI00281AC584|nr:MmcQ/YjbR family DNA-binding protein [Candidatus Termiticorpusculum sp.]MCL2256800.1 MmcQ/YjbR family DNA-binding protein [Candidatus Termiticorpusculum sp.]MCL2293078.1 MmcQ/YjbR family DNA-binding protein [Candidatus Termiticorpusculum sp.]MDR0460069.1 MmcQ/YjbR family DNA-binding protein [Nitrososphaerota archaeon]